MPECQLNDFITTATMTSFTHVTVDAKANVYFDGKVVSHTVHFADGSKKTLGLIYPGTYHFGTAAPERMEIIAGDCKVRLDGSSETAAIEAGSSFDVAGNSGFTIAVEEGICEYICSFLTA
jgi:purine/pyrimidine-nucleoside phosphorylase